MREVIDAQLDNQIVKNKTRDVGVDTKKVSDSPGSVDGSCVGGRWFEVRVGGEGSDVLREQQRVGLLTPVPGALKPGKVTC